MIDEQKLKRLKYEYLYEILKAEEVRSSSALFAYAKYLNETPLQYEYFPLYLKIFEANNQYAVDALLNGFEPEQFLDLVVVPNHFVLKSVFKSLDLHRSNTLYVKTVRVFGGFLYKFYHIVEEGFRIYEPTVADVNNLGKHLDETRDQNDPGNRGILDILRVLSELDRDHEQNKAKLDVGRQSNKIRADFLDNQRILLNAITQPILEKSDTVDFGIAPEQLQ